MKASQKFVNQIQGLMEPLVGNNQVGPVHIAMYLALLQCSAGRTGWFAVRPEDVMKLAKVKGFGTYYRVVRELEVLAVVEYRASRCWKKESRVRIKSR